MKIKSSLWIVIFAVLLSACAKTPEPPPPTPPPVVENPEPQPLPPPAPDFDFDKYQPNELGEIPVWMYHNIKEPEAIWVRTPANFRSDLQRFYDLGYRLTALTDVITNNISVPVGTSPIVLTFDDGNVNNFKLIKNPQGEIIIDPDCAVGIIMDFAKEHPDMGTAATFFVHLPHPFSQSDSWYTGEHRTWKLEKLREWGMEIGNHTLNHKHLKNDIKSLSQLLEQLGKPQQILDNLLPGARFNAIALPFGVWPVVEWRDYLYQGQYEDVPYQHDVVLLVGSTPAKPFNHVGYSPQAMPRVRASNFPDGNAKDFLDQALKRLGKTRYISDGDPQIITIPETVLDKLNPDSIGDKELRTYIPALD